MAIQDQSGTPIAGYELDDCTGIEGDHISQVVCWSTGGNVNPLAGRNVRLKFELKNADLFAFRFLPKLYAAWHCRCQ